MLNPVTQNAMIKLFTTPSRRIGSSNTRIRWISVQPPSVSFSAPTTVRLIGQSRNTPSTKKHIPNIM